MCLIPNARRLLGKLLAHIGLKGKVWAGPAPTHEAHRPTDWEEASGTRRETRT